MIKALLFDVDDTLLDFEETARLSMRDLFEKYDFPFDDAAFSVFQAINRGLWQDLEQGKLTSEELHRVRWKIIFDALGIRFDGERFEGEFRAGLAKHAPLIPGAREVLQACKGKYVVCVASNSSVDQQMRRLRLSGLLPLVEKFYFSESVGAAKPSAAFFAFCLNDLRLDKSEVLLLGDSLSADVRGALAYGIPVCWYCPQEGEIPEDAAKVPRIAALSQLMDIIGRMNAE